MRCRKWNSLSLALAVAIPGGCSVSWDTPGPQELYLKNYVDAHFHALGTEFVDALSRTDFLTQLRRTRVLYLGDHHRDVQLHARMLELLDWICAQGLRPVIGMEAIGSQDNPSLQEFLVGGIQLDALRRRIVSRWPLSWLERQGVDRAFFRDLLRRTHRHKLDAFPLEPTPRFGLDHRDGVIATNIRRALRLYPDRLILVIVGHAHILGDGHLLGRVGAPSMTIAARCSPVLTRAIARHPPVGKHEFLRTDRGVLFFPPRSVERISGAGFGTQSSEVRKP